MVDAKNLSHAGETAKWLKSYCQDLIEEFHGTESTAAAVIESTQVRQSELLDLCEQLIAEGYTKDDFDSLLRDPIVRRLSVDYIKAASQHWQDIQSFTHGNTL